MKTLFSVLVALVLTSVPAFSSEAEKAEGNTYFESICKTTLLFPEDFCVRWLKFDDNNVLRGNMGLVSTYSPADIPGHYYITLQSAQYLVEARETDLLFVGLNSTLAKLASGQVLPTQTIASELPADRLALQIDFEAWNSAGIEPRAKALADQLISAKQLAVETESWGTHGEITYCVTATTPEAAKSFAVDLVEGLKTIEKMRGPVLVKALRNCSEKVLPPDLPY